MEHEVRRLFLVNNSTAPEVAFEIMDGAIERFQAALFALKSHRNTLPPISRLPPEILSSIFVILKEIEPPNRSQTGLTWVKWTTHVCRHWRYVGINSPCLWVDPPMNRFPWVYLMLQRSQDAPLVIDYDFIHPFGGLKLALEHGHRIKTLALHVKSERTWDKMQRLFPEIAPQLESLSLVAQSGTYFIFDYDDILIGTPKLRHLEISSFYFGWIAHINLLRGLTHFKLYRVFLDPWSLFADVLKGMPGLETLHLICSLPTSPLNEVPWVPIHFDSLQSIIVESLADEVEALFSFITFPPTAKMIVNCYVPDRLSSGFSTILARFAQQYSSLPPDNHFQTLVLMKPPAFGLKVQLLVENLADEKILNPSNINSHALLEFTLAWTSYYSYDTTSFKLKQDMDAILPCGLPLQRINRVVLGEAIPYFTAQTLADTIGQLHQVHSVIALREVTGLFIEALKLSSVNGDATPCKPVYFFNLSSINLHRSRLDGSQSKRHHRRYHYKVLLDELRDCLAQRSQCGAKLAMITFVHCRGVTKSAVDLFSEVVGEVNCKELPKDDEDSDDEDGNHGDTINDMNDNGDDGNDEDSSSESLTTVKATRMIAETRYTVRAMTSIDGNGCMYTRALKDGDGVNN